MLLNEFFGRNPGIENKEKSKSDNTKEFDDDLFYYILDNDKLHKDYFFEIAKKLKKLNECSEGMIYEMFMPMVVKGCKEYYHHKKMEGRMATKFPKEMREGLCKKLYDHYHNDVKKEIYRIG